MLDVAACVRPGTVLFTAYDIASPSNGGLCEDAVSERRKKNGVRRWLLAQHRVLAPRRPGEIQLQEGRRKFASSCFSDTPRSAAPVPSTSAAETLGLAPVRFFLGSVVRSHALTGKVPPAPKLKSVLEKGLPVKYVGA